MTAIKQNIVLYGNSVDNIMIQFFEDRNNDVKVDIVSSPDVVIAVFVYDTTLYDIQQVSYVDGTISLITDNGALTPSQVLYSKENGKLMVDSLSNANISMTAEDKETLGKNAPLAMMLIVDGNIVINAFEIYNIHETLL